MSKTTESRMISVRERCKAALPPRFALAHLRTQCSDPGRKVLLPCGSESERRVINNV